MYDSPIIFFFVGLGVLIILGRTIRSIAHNGKAHPGTGIMVWLLALIMFGFRLIEFRPISGIAIHNKQKIYSSSVIWVGWVPSSSASDFFTSDYYISIDIILTALNAVKLVDLLSNQTEYMAENIRIISSILLATFSFIWIFVLAILLCVDISFDLSLDDFTGTWSLCTRWSRAPSARCTTAEELWSPSGFSLSCSQLHPFGPE